MTYQTTASQAAINTPDTILIGIGNSGRQDDGLGWAFLDAVKEKGLFKGEIIYRYQLQIEDAEMISHARQVIFVDAFAGELESGFKWKNGRPSRDFAFTTHVLPPEAILFLCEDLYGKTIPAKVMLLEGKEWELEMGITEEAQEHLELAVSFFHNLIKKEK